VFVHVRDAWSHIVRDPQPAEVDGPRRRGRGYETGVKSRRSSLRARAMLPRAPTDG
jgi:hypothetical protein